MHENKLPNNPFADWDRLNTLLLRYWTKYEEKGKTLKSDKAKEKHNAEFKREVQFLIRRAADPDFHIFLNKRLNYTKEDGRPSGLVIPKHMQALVKFIILDKPSQNQGKFVKLWDPLVEWKDEEYQSYGHLLRMVNDYYSELVTTKDEIQERTGRRKWSNDRDLKIIVKDC